jgi:hypothetical protein
MHAAEKERENSGRYAGSQGQFNISRVCEFGVSLRGLGGAGAEIGDRQTGTPGDSCLAEPVRRISPRSAGTIP